MVAHRRGSTHARAYVVRTASILCCDYCASASSGCNRDRGTEPRADTCIAMATQVAACERGTSLASIALTLVFFVLQLTEVGMSIGVESTMEWRLWLDWSDCCNTVQRDQGRMSTVRTAASTHAWPLTMTSRQRGCIACGRATNNGERGGGSTRNPFFGQRPMGTMQMRCGSAIINTSYGKY